MKFVVVIPFIDRLDMTRNCVQSYVDRAPGHTVEFVMVDNGSAPAAVEWCRSVPGRTIRNETNLGVSKAWNQGLTAALEMSPDCIILSNNDLLVADGWAGVLAAAFAEKGWNYFVPNGELKNSETFANEARLFPAKYGTERVRVSRCGWCMAFTPEAVREFLPVPEELFLWYGDDYIHEKLADARWKCWSLKAWPVIHFGSQTFQSAPNRDARLAQDRTAWNRIRTENRWQRYVILPDLGRVKAVFREQWMSDAVLTSFIQSVYAAIEATNKE